MNAITNSYPVLLVLFACLLSETIYDTSFVIVYFLHTRCVNLCSCLDWLSFSSLSGRALISHLLSGALHFSLESDGGGQVLQQPSWSSLEPCDIHMQRTGSLYVGHLLVLKFSMKTKYVCKGTY